MAAWFRARPGDDPPAGPACDRADPSDSALVAAARADRRAFAPLYNRYVDPVYRYCLRRLGDRAAAEDATSQVFSKGLANNYVSQAVSAGPSMSTNHCSSPGKRVSCASTAAIASSLSRTPRW